MMAKVAALANYILLQISDVNMKNVNVITLTVKKIKILAVSAVMISSWVLQLQNKFKIVSLKLL